MSPDFPLPPLTLYIHLPWCVRKCPYCDFNSHRAPADLPAQAYVDALLADLESDLSDLTGLDDRPLESIYLGGGTPSLFPAPQIARLLRGVRARVAVRDGAEITLEANPGAADQARFAGFRQAGINRLSIGVQSFCDPFLRALGRIHDGAQALAAANSARAAGVENFNLDLMFGLPGQSVEDALADLQTALALAPTHLSLYQLTLEPNTPFFEHPPPLPAEETCWTMHQHLHETLAEGGYGPYEVSAFARPGARSQHNLNYWRFGDYLGIGAGAHGKLTTGDGIVRVAKRRHPATYLKQAGTPKVREQQQRLSDAQRRLEFMMNALRLTDGFKLDLFEARTALNMSSIEATLREAQDKALLTIEEGLVVPTAAGRRYLNDLVMLFA